MKKQSAIILSVALLITSLTACGNSNSDGNSKNQPQNSQQPQQTSQQTGSDGQDGAVVTPGENVGSIDDLGFIDNTVTCDLIDAGYSLEHASQAQSILNKIGINSIKIESMTGKPESGLNAVVCYPNGKTDRDRRFYFTTEDGVIFYAGFLNEDLYDTDKGGYLKNYNDVHVPEKEVTIETYNTLRELAKSTVKDYLNYPNSASFSSLNWGIGRSDDKYQVIGTVSAENAFGVSDDMSFSVWFVASGDSYTVEGVAIDGVRVK